MPCSLLKATPKVPTTPVKAKRVSTFQEFESNTSDAWDAGEDDDELLAMAAERLNSDVVMETAHRVLRDHSQRQEQHKLQEPPGPGQKPKPAAEPPPVASGDLRLVKSVSESHAPCPAGGLGRSWCAPPQEGEPCPCSRSPALKAPKGVIGAPKASPAGEAARSSVPGSQPLAFSWRAALALWAHHERVQ